MKRDVTAVVVAVLLGCFGAPVAANAQGAKPNATDPLLLGIEEAYRHIKNDYVDPIDDDKILSAAVDGMVAVTVKSDTLYVTRRGSVTGFADVATLFRKINETSDGAIDKQELAYAAISAMVATLDRQSRYIGPTPWRESSAAAAPVGSIGLNVAMRSGAITIVSPIDNGPADRAGILAGDVIKAIDGAPVSGQSLSEIIAKLRGPVGSKITLTVIGALHRRATKVNIVREVVHAQAIAADVYDNIARLTISRFNEQTSAELRAALKKIEAQARPADIKGYIFDLRDNAGGLLDAAIAFADDFLDSGVIAKIKARDVETESFVAKPGDLISGKPIAVLINGGTAAGAEIVAAALQANRRAIVIGTRSIGAGTIQTVIALGDGNGALRLTTSLVFTPSGVSLDSHGVTPDETVADPQAQAGSGASPNKVPPDAQLDAALTLLGRRQ